MFTSASVYHSGNAVISRNLVRCKSTAGGSNGNNVVVVFVLDFGRGEAARPAGVSFGSDELRAGEPLCHSSSWKTTVLENLLDSSGTLGALRLVD